MLLVSCDTNGHPWVGLGYNRFNCGARDHSVYGKTCKMCYNDHQVALKAEMTLAPSKIYSSTPYNHILMYDTKHPPEVIDACSRECNDISNTVKTPATTIY